MLLSFYYFTLPIIKANSVKTRAFLVPKWGGIYIDSQTTKTNSSNKIEVDEAMKTFLTQFIDLMGFDLHKVSL